MRSTNETRMEFAEFVSFPTVAYKKAIESKLTYLQDNIVSALYLRQISRCELENRELEDYACGQAEMLAEIVEVAMQ